MYSRIHSLQCQHVTYWHPGDRCVSCIHRVWLGWIDQGDWERVSLYTWWMLLHDMCKMIVRYIHMYFCTCENMQVCRWEFCSVCVYMFVSHDLQLCVRFMRDSIAVDTVCEFTQVRALPPTVYADSQLQQFKLYIYVMCAGSTDIPANNSTGRMPCVHWGTNSGIQLHYNMLTAHYVCCTCI